jgi:hypothetical protein
MNIAQIEETISNLIKNINPDTFIYDLLLAYGLPKASISRLQNGNLNLSKHSGEISWKKKVLFRVETEIDLHHTISGMHKEAKHAERFVITTDFKTILAIDTKTNDKLDISLDELHKHFDFFLPWAGMEKAQHQDENPADVKAAEKMAKLFDEIKRDNPDSSPEFVHNLNVFLSRLLFCYFAEDTNIFEQSQFVNSISSHTQADGSDTGEYFDKLFTVLNTPRQSRKDFPAYLDAFPYVNGGLFKLGIKAPAFTRRSRQAIIDSGDMDWSSINPDIFGSMMQAVVTPENRGGLGMHYTSVPNIMKVIGPLFLNELYEEYEKAKGNAKKLNALLDRIAKIKIFDPACGSGNFLIIAYKELRKLEMMILKSLYDATGQADTGMSRISLSQFYGIEIDDFAHEIAQLSLWLAEHQMNVEFFKEFGCTNPTLPLKENGHIEHGNACRLDWNIVCPKTADSEVYVLGNPPYIGASVQLDEQKKDKDIVFKDINGYKILDYIACWFYLATQYSQKSNVKVAFVSTNSICQGEQVNVLWAAILNFGLEIFFAFTSFKWKNNAKLNAGVTVIIVGLRNISTRNKYLFTADTRQIVYNINPYLAQGKNILIAKRSSPISCLQIMEYGSKIVDGGYLILDDTAKEAVTKDFPGIEKFIKRYIGSDELLYGVKRWCFWIDDKDLEQALRYEVIKNRINSVRNYRLSSKKQATKDSALTPHIFGEPRYKNASSIIIPAVSSELRDYIPIDFYSKDAVVTNRNFAIYNPELYIFGVITSQMHMTWVRAVAGRLETRFNYSSTICYNAFPFHNITEEKKNEISRCVLNILSEREKHPEKTLAELYDPDKMPDGLREAHHQNDIAVERCYRSKPFTSGEERLEHLFKLYEQMIEEEKTRGTIFEAEVNAGKKPGQKKT